MILRFLLFASVCISVIIYQFAVSETLIDSSRVEELKAVEECDEAAGNWFTPAISAVNSEVKPYCILPTSDAGALCESSKDCESVCISVDAVNQGEKASGQCFEWSNAIGHCITMVENRISTGEICFD